MAAPLEWSTDPVVLLEKDIQPVLSAAPEWLLSLRHPSADVSGKSELFETAIEALRTGSVEKLGRADVVMPPEDIALCAKAAAATQRVKDRLEDSKAASTQVFEADTLDLIQTQMRPLVDEAIDVIRRNFIGTVLARQVQQANNTTTAVQKLFEVSRSIFFISVNASVEAARLGEKGAGFAFISGEMRALSKDAQSSTEKLMKIVKNPDALV